MQARFDFLAQTVPIWHKMYQICSKHIVYCHKEFGKRGQKELSHESVPNESPTVVLGLRDLPGSPPDWAEGDDSAPQAGGPAAPGPR